MDAPSTPPLRVGEDSASSTALVVVSPVKMMVVFNSLGFLATLVACAQGDPVLLPAVVFVVTLIVTPVAC